MPRPSSPRFSTSMLRRLAIGAWLMFGLALLWGVAQLHPKPAPPVVIAHALYLGG